LLKTVEAALGGQLIAGIKPAHHRYSTDVAMMADNYETLPEDDHFEAQVTHVISDFQAHTLGEMRTYFHRIIYLASLRDYNTGRYHHYGLEIRYPREVVDEGLHRCHIKEFEELVALPLKDQTDDLLFFFESLKEEKSRLVQAWQRLRSYQVLPPENCHPLARQLFDKNIEVILTILRQTDLWPLLRDSHGDADDLT
jgi:hypothetical protein